MTSGTTENSRVSSNTGAMKMYAAVHSRPLAHSPARTVIRTGPARTNAPVQLHDLFRLSGQDPPLSALFPASAAFFSAASGVTVPRSAA